MFKILLSAPPIARLGWELSVGGSIVAVEVDACDVFGAVGEAVEGDLQCGGTRRREDVG